MERESQSASARLIAQLGDRLPYMNFYRFCQLLEQSQPDKPVTGSTWQVRHEPVRFRPHSGMGFPASEIKGAELPEHPHLPPTIRTTFMGLYGVESPLPTHYIDDIAQRREGYEANADFLDIFNHRLIAQYYRIWRKYSYPATFEEGGKDKTSQYLLGLAGLGIDGCTDHSGACFTLSGAAAGDVVARTYCGRHGFTGASSGTQYAGKNLAPRQASDTAEEIFENER